MMYSYFFTVILCFGATDKIPVKAVIERVKLFLTR